MKAYQAVFERFEQKYMMNEEQYHTLIPLLEKFMQWDEYGLCTICTLYFDTDDYSVARMSSNNKNYKEKLRLRSYGVPDSDDIVFAELKKKTGGVVYKRRTALTCEDAESSLEIGKMPLPSMLLSVYNENSELPTPCDPTQILSEIAWFVNRWSPSPKVMLCYERLAMFGKENPLFRVTFDFNARWRVTELNLSSGDGGTALFDSKCGQYCLMEIKTWGAVPVDLSRILSQMGVFPISYSKYTNACRIIANR